MSIVCVNFHENPKMMLSAHNNIPEESDKWAHLRFTHHQQQQQQEASVGKSIDLSLSSSEDEQQQPLPCSMPPSDIITTIEDESLIIQVAEEIQLKRTKVLEKRVSFPSDESKLVSHFTEPQALESSSDGQPEEVLLRPNLVDIYLSSCMKNETIPIENIIEQLKTLDLNSPRSANLTLRGVTLGPHDCESLEDVLKHIPLKLLDLGASHCSDDGLIALFDMIEFYEAASHVSFAAYKHMTTRGWQACCRMIKRTECLEWLDAAQVGLSEHSSTLLAKALRADSRLRVLQLNGCNLSGRPAAIIASSLRINRNLRELHLAENKLSHFDALQIGILLTGNRTLELLDLRNNDIGDKGMAYLCDALLDNAGLSSLIVWNNGITHESSTSLNKTLAGNHTLQTLNLGCNKLGDEGVMGMIPGGLERNRHLLNLGLQSNQLTCCGVISLAETLASGTQLRRVDLRKNAFQLAGLMALAVALKLSPSVTCLDINITPSDNAAEYERLQKEIEELCLAHHKVLIHDDVPIVSNVPSTEEDTSSSTPKLEHLAEDISARKVSLTCPIPPDADLMSGKCAVPVIVTQEDQESHRQQRVSRRFRSPLPSPLPSPVASPGGRFKVVRVDSESSPLPSPRSRFTVTAVSESSSSSTSSTSTTSTTSTSTSFSGSCNTTNTDVGQSTISSNQPDNESTNNGNLIRRSPSKIVVGFDVQNDV